MGGSGIEVWAQVGGECRSSAMKAGLDGSERDTFVLCKHSEGRAVDVMPNDSPSLPLRKDLNGRFESPTQRRPMRQEVRSRPRVLERSWREDRPAYL